MATEIDVIEMTPDALARLREEREKHGHPFEDLTLSRIPVGADATSRPYRYYLFAQHAAATLGGEHRQGTIVQVMAMRDEHAEKYYVQS